ncbi:MAG: hypothetical protein AAFV53_14320 [Myxococcota bacterium]
MSVTLDRFTRIFSSVVQRREVLRQRVEKARSDLIDLQLLIDRWRTTGGQQDLRWQLFDGDLAKNVDKLIELEAEGEDNPNTAAAHVKELQGKITKLLDGARSEFETDASDSPYTTLNLVDTTIIEAGNVRKWLSGSNLQIIVRIVAPNEMLDSFEGEELSDAARDAVLRVRQDIVDNIIIPLDNEIDAAFSTRISTSPTREELEAAADELKPRVISLQEKIRQANAQIRIKALEAETAGIEAAENKIAAVITDRATREKYKYSFKRTLVLGSLALGAAISSLVLSAGADGFAWYSGAMAISKLGKEIYDHFRATIAIQEELQGHIENLEGRIDETTQKLNDFAASGSEATQAILSELKIPSSISGMFLTTISSAERAHTQFVNRLQIVREKLKEMHGLLLDGLADAQALKASPVVDDTKAQALETAISETIDNIIDLYSSKIPEGSRFANDAHRVIKTYKENLMGIDALSKYKKFYKYREWWRAAVNVDKMATEPLGIGVVPNTLYDGVKIAVKALI